MECVRVVWRSTHVSHTAHILLFCPHLKKPSFCQTKYYRIGQNGPQNLIRFFMKRNAKHVNQHFQEPEMTASTKAD